MEIALTHTELLGSTIAANHCFLSLVGSATVQMSACVSRSRFNRVLVEQALKLRVGVVKVWADPHFAPKKSDFTRLLEPFDAAQARDRLPGARNDHLFPLLHEDEQG